MAENEYNRNEEEDLSQVEGMAEDKVKEGIQDIKEAAKTIKRVKGKKNPEDDESEKEGSEDDADSDSDTDAGEKNGDSSGSEKDSNDDNDADKNDDSSKDDTEGKDDAENGTDSTDKDTGTDEPKTSPSGEKNKPEGEEDGKESKSGHDSNDKQSSPGENPAEGAADDSSETNQSKKNLSNSQKGQGTESGPDGTGNENRQRSLQDKKKKNENSSGGKAKAKSEGSQGSKSGKKTASKSGKKSAKKGSKKSEKASGEATKKIWGWLVSAFGIGGAIIFVLCAFLFIIIISVFGVIAAATGNTSGGSVGGAPLSGSAAQRLIQIAHQEKGTLQSGSDKYVLPMGGTSGDPWCAYYAGWLLKQVGVDVDSVGWSAAVPSWTAELKSKNLFHLRGTYTPQTGDAIIYGEDTHHVGIVLEAKDGKVYTSEGNTWGDTSSNMVWEHEFSLDDTRIYGYGEIRVSTASTGSGGGSGNFTPRLTCPESNDRHYFSNENPFYQNPALRMPNCTTYAWGRAYELMGSPPELSTGNAQDWYGYNKENHIYEYGSEPRLGAILCMERAGGGHVAVVEKIEPDGTITTSESAYNGTMFYTLTRQKGYYQYDDRYTVQGFIYIPVAGGSSSTYSSSYSNGFAEFARQVNAWMGNGGTGLSGNLSIANRTNYNQEESIRRTYQLLRQYGFSKAIACGIMGNIMGECSFDPNTYFAEYVPDVGGAPDNSGGICMWYSENCDRFKHDCPNWGTSLDAQVEYLCKTLELNEHGELSEGDRYFYYCAGLLTKLKSYPNSKYGAMQVAAEFMHIYENPDTLDSSLRESYAAEYWDTMSDNNDPTITNVISNGGLR